MFPIKISREQTKFFKVETLAGGFLLLAASAFPLMWLHDPRNTFMVDWFNHSWMISYFGAFFKVHAAFPVVFNTFQYIGDPAPLYYGNLFYPLFGPASLIFGASNTIRICAMLMSMCQLGFTFQLIRKLNGSQVVAGLGSLSLLWSTYSLTNLYNRSALTEYFSTGLFQVLVVAIWMAVICQTRIEKRRWVWIGILAAVLTAGWHPITLVAGAVFILFSLPLWGFFRGKLAVARWIGQNWIFTGFGLSAALLSMGAWIYVAVTTSKDLAMSGFISKVQNLQFDTFWSRLLPFPFDIRMWFGKDLLSQGTPHLDTQVSTVLLALFILLLRSAWPQIAPTSRSILKYWVVVFWIIFYLSCDAEHISYVRTLLVPIQFQYRLVTYLNLGLANGIFFLLWTQRTCDGPIRLSEKFKDISVAAILCLILISQLVVKLNHAAFNMDDQGGEYLGSSGNDPDRFLKLVDQFYGQTAYTTPNLYKKLDVSNLWSQTFAPSIALSPGTGEQFGLAQDLKVQIPVLDRRLVDSYHRVCVAPQSSLKSQWVKTNVLAHNWGHLYVDGTLASEEDLRIVDGNNTLTVKLNAGNHVLSYRFEPPRFLTILRLIQILGMMLIGAGSLFVVFEWAVSR